MMENIINKLKNIPKEKLSIISNVTGIKQNRLMEIIESGNCEISEKIILEANLK